MVTLLIVPGIAASAGLFAPLQKYLSQRFPTLKTHCLTLPSISGPPNPPAPLSDDTHTIVAKVRELWTAAPDEEIVLLGHGSGGVSISHALEYVGSKTVTEGHRGVDKIILVSGIMLNAGTSGWDLAAATRLPASMRVGEHYLELDPQETASVALANLPPKVAAQYAGLARYQSLVAFKDKATHEGWNDLDQVHYILCEQDQVFPMFGQRVVVQVLRDSGANVTEWTLKGADHAPHVDANMMPALGDYIEKVCGL